MEAALAEVDGIVKSIVFNLNKDQNLNDDLISEGRIAAWKAIREFDSRKKAKLETFVYRCVENRVKNIQKMERRRPDCVSNEIPENVFENFDLIDLEISAQMVLSPFEYDVFTKYRAGFTFGEIGGAMEMGYPEVSLCFTHICQKLRSSEMNLT